MKKPVKGKRKRSEGKEKENERWNSTVGFGMYDRLTAPSLFSCLACRSAAPKKAHRFADLSLNLCRGWPKTEKRVGLLGDPQIQC